MLEVLKKCGVEEDKANEIVKAMGEAKIYTTNLENVDVRYNKLQEQKKQLEEASSKIQTDTIDLIGKIKDFTKTITEETQGRSNNNSKSEKENN